MKLKVRNGLFCVIGWRFCFAGSYVMKFCCSNLHFILFFLEAKESVGKGTFTLNQFCGGLWSGFPSNEDVIIEVFSLFIFSRFI